MRAPLWNAVHREMAFNNVRTIHIFFFFLTSYSKRCPQCQARAKVQDIRRLYVSTLVATNSSETSRLEKELAVERRLRAKESKARESLLIKYQALWEKYERSQAKALQYQKR